ncbi:hypothetical protein OESDEN_22168 [Oesophagostomum dentatum]|uniref:Peptidase C1A papain C-terminal domain-containing protein n=1 Tax=Oesophagostomum dentatum TaxID=61180 RepID=A0A0B1S404_OESDE|nr:hypothetical protein OESDEN_22168 [Oesophagostomum dentatum]
MDHARSLGGTRQSAERRVISHTASTTIMIKFMVSPCPDFKEKKGVTLKSVLVTSYYFLPNNETAIMREIMTNGPVTAGFIVYSDFSSYKGGVYVVRHLFFVDLLAI